MAIIISKWLLEFWKNLISFDSVLNNTNVCLTQNRGLFTSLNPGLCKDDRNIYSTETTLFVVYFATDSVPQNEFMDKYLNRASNSCNLIEVLEFSSWDLRKLQISQDC
jgi:hypothetical protein